MKAELNDGWMPLPPSASSKHSLSSAQKRSSSIKLPPSLCSLVSATTGFRSVEQALKYNVTDGESQINPRRKRSYPKSPILVVHEQDVRDDHTHLSISSPKIDAACHANNTSLPHCSTHSSRSRDPGEKNTRVPGVKETRRITRSGVRKKRSTEREIERNVYKLLKTNTALGKTEVSC